MKILREGRYRWMEEISVQNIVIGSGAAGLAAALRLAQGGQAGTVIATENLNAGTSRNTGSDKQTYYKLSLAAGDPDSVRDMAEDLFDGQCVDGDQALCEAALSVRGFMSLVDLGVPFPCTEYGEYMGYKTDHDRGRRATSAGPYTSRMMTEALETAVRQRQIPIYDHTRALKLLVKDNRVHGVLCLKQHASGASFVIFWGANIVLATGGPAAMYLDSVYPQSQLGSSGMAFEAGVPGKNLTEWQFGMASVSKAGVSMLTTLYADRLAREGILVHEVRPGVIATDMTSAVQEKYDRLIADGVFPIARWGTPEDVANAVSAFCSDKFQYTTGNYLDVDGGFHIKRL